MWKCKTNGIGKERKRERKSGRMRNRKEKKKVREMINLALPTGQVKTKDFPFPCKSAFAPFSPLPLSFSPFFCYITPIFIHHPPLCMHISPFIALKNLA